ncbi:MAG: riboflavin biosynthesis protein RibF [Flaviaesturariibacter sp.]|nr:riboflavin biosynthesis protein RibF [Flaviaesturariibacter sp.]
MHKSTPLPLYLSGSMQVHYDTTQLPGFKNAVITIGTFDGVHQGHQQLIGAMKTAATQIEGETVLVTFQPHPRKILQPERSLELINTLDERIELLSKQCIDHLVIVEFTPAFSKMSADEYISQFLVERFHPHTIIIGYDHHFGANREGNFSLLEQKKELFGYQLTEIPKHVLNEISISSTKIREALQNGAIEDANDLLGYSFSFEGKVIHGDKLGRQLGYPTANLIYTDVDKIHLGEGVFAVWVDTGKEQKKGMLSIGKRPTLNDTIERVEVNLFDFSGDLYDKTIRLKVISFLRPQEKYKSLDELIAQLDRDKSESLNRL